MGRARGARVGGRAEKARIRGVLVLVWDIIRVGRLAMAKCGRGTIPAGRVAREDGRLEEVVVVVVVTAVARGGAGAGGVCAMCAAGVVPAESVPEEAF